MPLLPQQLTEPGVGVGIGLVEVGGRKLLGVGLVEDVLGVDVLLGVGVGTGVGEGVGVTAAISSLSMACTVASILASASLACTVASISDSVLPPQAASNTTAVERRSSRMALRFIQSYYPKRIRNGSAEATACHLTAVSLLLCHRTSRHQ